MKWDSIGAMPTSSSTSTNRKNGGSPTENRCAIGKRPCGTGKTDGNRNMAKDKTIPRLEINMQRVEELMSMAPLKPTTTPRFRFNVSTAEALNLLTAAYINQVKSRCCQFILDENTKANLVSLAESITHPVPKFGFMFCGNPGNGKTTLLRAFASVIDLLGRNAYLGFKEGEYRSDRDSLVIKSAKEIAVLPEDDRDYLTVRNCPLLGIDDLGTEPAEVLEYGNIHTPLSDLLELRYDKQRFTIVTSNLTPTQIRAKYKDRVADRCNEMMHVLVFKDITYRKQ